jgi:Tol biopolymer transport system component
VLNADGSEWRLLPGPAHNPDWSPDGTRIVFSGPVGHWGGPIMVARSDGGGVTRLTGQDPDLEEAWPAWSPDGTRIAFTRAELGPFGPWRHLGHERGRLRGDQPVTERGLPGLVAGRS